MVESGKITAKAKKLNIRKRPMVRLSESAVREAVHRGYVKSREGYVLKSASNYIRTIEKF